MVSADIKRALHCHSTAQSWVSGAQRRRKGSLPHIKSSWVRLVFKVANPDLLQSTPPRKFVCCFLFHHAQEEGLPCQEEVKEDQGQGTSWGWGSPRLPGPGDSPGPIFRVLLWVSSGYAQPITGQVTEVTCPVIGRAQHELTLSKRQKTGPGPGRGPCSSCWCCLSRPWPYGWCWSCCSWRIRGCCWWSVHFILFISKSFRLQMLLLSNFKFEYQFRKEN